MYVQVGKGKLSLGNSELGFDVLSYRYFCQKVARIRTTASELGSRRRGGARIRPATGPGHHQAVAWVSSMLRDGR